MRVALTGASGLIGRFIARAAIASGHTVVIASPRPASWMRVPVATPAGILMVSEARSRTRPATSALIPTATAMRRRPSASVAGR